jgi:FSR family fosmidomycin resistance protein-like MFS transporter
MNNSRLIAATYGHFSIDVVNSSVAMILTASALRFDLSIGQIGLGALIYQITAAMSQPLFGSLTDRLRGRWVGALGLLWTLAFYALASTMPTYPLFIGTLMIGGLGSGAFHAAGLLNASSSGGKRPTLATSVFFVGGQSGLAVGPVIAGILLLRMDLHAMPWIALAMAPAAFVMLFFMNDPLPAPPPAAARESAAAGTKRRGQTAAALSGAVAMTALFALITFRSGTAQSFATLLPKFYDEQGLTSAQYGLMLGIFAMSGAMGTFLGGFMGDRYNRRTVLVLVMFLSAPFAWMMLHTAGWQFVVMAIGAGIFLSIPHSIVLVMAQEMMPQRRGMMGGLTLGFIFASGSTVAWLASLAADRVGLPTVLSALALMPILAGLCALLLPAHGPTRTVIPEVLEPVPAAAD